MLGSLGFLFQESWLNLRRHGLMAIASISTAAVALTIFGVFILLAWHLNAIAEAIPRKIEIHAFPRPTATRDEVNALADEIRKFPDVVRVKVVPKEEAWADFQKHYRAEDLRGITENPLPDKFEVIAASPERTVAIAERVRQTAGIDRVNDAREVLQKLLTIAGIVRVVGLVLAVLLALGTAAIINNAIRMTLFARRRDIRVMQLVGATDAFIRFPFVMEGVAEGVLGGALACGVLAAALHYFTTRMLPDLPFINELHITLSLPLLCGGLVVGGALLGMAGSLFSLRRFLRTA
jgi:cell division transport system permease protein